MAEPSCACRKFQRLEGAATQAYIIQYLKRDRAEGGESEASYRCRVCGARWERLEEGAKRPSLIRVQSSKFEV